MKHLPRSPAGTCKSTRFRYLPRHPEAERWGGYVVGAGFTSVPGGSPYPPQGHPRDHQFTWSRGRVLPLHQFLLITRGKGEFESAAAGRQPLEAGDLLMLHPGVWHRYRPDPDSGWDEYWMEFGGDAVTGLFTPELRNDGRPVHRLGHEEALPSVVLEAIDLLHRDPPEAHLLLAAQAVRAVALIRSALKRRMTEGRPVDDIMREAKVMLSGVSGRSVRLESMAAQLGISYSQFRRLFKARTGYAPLQYALQQTHRRACDLLANTRRPVGQIAADLGYESIFFFSRQFKRMGGVSPLEYRNHGAVRATRPGAGGRPR